LNRLDVAHQCDGRTDRRSERPLAIAPSNDVRCNVTYTPLTDVDSACNELDEAGTAASSIMYCCNCLRNDRTVYFIAVVTVLIRVTYTCALSPRVMHTCTCGQQTTCLHSGIFLQLFLELVVYISFPKSIFHVFLGHRVPLRHCAVHCRVCLVMLSLMRFIGSPSSSAFISKLLL